MKAIRALSVFVGQQATRSLLEAKWLEFLREAGIDHQYECELVRLPSGGYCPDLWLPRQGAWGEVKPGDLSRKERSLAEELAWRTGKPVLLLVGPPSEALYEVVPVRDGSEWAQPASVSLADFFGFSQETLERSLRVALSHSPWDSARNRLLRAVSRMTDAEAARCLERISGSRAVHSSTPESFDHLFSTTSKE